MQGRLVEWNDDRGFGFIEADDRQRYFVHIKSIGRIATRPRIGDRLQFERGISRNGKIAAVDVRIAGANPLPTQAERNRGVTDTRPQRQEIRQFLALALLAILGIGLAVDTIPLWLGLTYFAVGLASFLSYGADKGFAEAGAWRVSEIRLHALDLCCGIIGGLLGQAVYRHKTSKQSFAAVTWLLTGVHALWLTGFALGRINADPLLKPFLALVGR